MKKLQSIYPSVLAVGLANDQWSALQSILRKLSCRTFACTRCRDAVELITLASVVICERRLPDGSWQNLLVTAEALAKPPALVVTSRVVDSGLWAEVLNLGGYDVLAQPFRAKEVAWIVGSAHNHFAGRRVVGTGDLPSANRGQFVGRTSLAENGHCCALSGSSPEGGVPRLTSPSPERKTLLAGNATSIRALTGADCDS